MTYLCVACRAELFRSSETEMKKEKKYYFCTEKVGHNIVVTLVSGQMMERVLMNLNVFNT